MINYLFEILFVLNVLNLEMCGICFLASFGSLNLVPSLLLISFNLLTADFLFLEKNVAIENKEKHHLNNFPLDKK
tara:strand:+ start:192 stop:416 length:225 start_codon:yes stop_codon:yes gene_type:complete